jgi:molecular chaperone GrpE
MFDPRGEMTRKHRPHQAPTHPQSPEQEPGGGEDSVNFDEFDAGAPGQTGPAAVPASAAGITDETLRRLEQEAGEWKDRCLRAAAEFENFKKRALRERTETWGRAQADLIARALDALDDLGRIAALDPTQTTSQALHEGAGLVERKLQKALEGVGLERVDPAGQPFDPNLHEAVMTMPAASPDADHTVGSVFQPGYRLNGTLLRPARVAVLTWTEPAAGEAAQ